MSNASDCANYRARRRDECRDRQIQQNQEVIDLLKILIAKVDALEARLDDRQIEQNQWAENFPPYDHVDMGVNDDDRHIERNQHVGQAQPEPHAGARVVGISSLTESKKKEKETNQDARAREFEVWWRIWPHKVCKPAAVAAYKRAAAKVPLDVLCEGVERYIAQKPADRPWCNPSTWLNQERWDDRPAPIAPRRDERQFCIGIG